MTVSHPILIGQVFFLIIAQIDKGSTANVSRVTTVLTVSLRVRWTGAIAVSDKYHP